MLGTNDRTIPPWQQARVQIVIFQPGLPMALCIAITSETM